MKNQQNILTSEQTALIKELVTEYGIEATEVTFFSGDPKPFLGYEATTVLCNYLTDLHDINIEPVQNFFVDSLPLRCKLTLADGRTRSAVGVANVNETDSDNKKLSEQQIYYLASARAIRNALRASGIDLIKLHIEQKLTGRRIEYSGSPLSNYDNLLRQVHVLGQEADLIIGEDKGPWRKIIMNRYGVWHSNELNEEQLADFAAVLRTLVPQVKAAA